MTVAPPPKLPATPTDTGPRGSAAALLQEVQVALDSLAQLEPHRARMGDDVVSEALSVVADCRRRLGRPNLYVCVIGEAKAGKSTFLNALLGRRVMATAVRECTGTVTYIRRALRPNYTAQLVDGSTETLNDICPDRDPHLLAAIDACDHKVAEYIELTSRLPREVLDLDLAINGHVAAIVDLTAVRNQADEADEQVRAALSSELAEFTQFESTVRDASKGIPFFYRERQVVWKPWIWGSRAIFKLNTKPEWTAHGKLVDKLHQHKIKLEARKKESHDAFARACEAARAVHAREADLASDRNRVAAMRQQIADLPKLVDDQRIRRESHELERVTHAAERSQCFHEEVPRLTDMEARGRDVLRLDISYPAAHLPEGLVIVDTPGVNTEKKEEESRAWAAIEQEADGCMVLSDLQKPVSQTTREFVGRVREYVPHLVLILTKVDRALAGAALDEESADAQVEEARRDGEAKFASEVGRDRSEIVSFAVSAERALRDDMPGAATRFAADVSRLMDLLAGERTMVVGARSAAAIQRMAGEIAACNEKAETAYRERIAFLEAQQIDDPRSFCERQVGGLENSLRPGAYAAVAAGKDAILRAMSELAETIVENISTCDSRAELKQYIESIQARGTTITATVESAVGSAMEETLERHMSPLEEPLLAALRERYRIVGHVIGQSAALVNTGRITTAHDVGDLMGSALRGTFDSAQKDGALGVMGGAMGGAAIGSIIPGIGTLVGGVIGGVVGVLFGPSLDDIKRDCARNVVEGIESAAEAAVESMDGTEARLVVLMRDGLRASLNAAVDKYRSWIAGVIKEHNAEVACERQQLAHLLQLRATLQGHDTRLQDFMQRAAAEYPSLCRTPAGRTTA